MPCTFAGRPLPLPTPQVMAWAERFVPQLENVEAEVPHWFGSGLPVPSAPNAHQRRVRLGVLSWPTGATRWATFHALVDTDALAAVRAAVGSVNAAAPLVLDDGTGSVTASMYMLPARPLAQIAEGDGSERGLYLLSLVDRRYHWWFRQADLTVDEGSTTWADLFEQIGSALGVSIAVEEVPAAYGTPTARWSRWHDPLPVVLDAAARAVGARVVAATGGAVAVARPGAAYAACDAAYAAAAPRRAAGGRLAVADVRRHVPRAVDVVFRAAAEGAERETVSKTLASLGVDGYGPATGMAGHAALVWADPVYDAATADAYAEQAATDWYLWRRADADAAFAGVVGWTPTGMEDRIEWEWSPHVVRTRVCRPPFWDEAKDFGGGGGGGGDGFFFARVTGRAAGPPVRYSWRKITLQPSGAWGWATPVVSGGFNAFRAPSADYDEDVLPAIPNDQSVLMRRSSTNVTGYEMTPWGGQRRRVMRRLVDTKSQCVTGSIWTTNVFEYNRWYARDLRVTRHDSFSEDGPEAAISGG